MTDPNSTQAGWRPSAWSRDTGIGRSKTFEIIGRGDVDSVLVDGMRIILTSPREFLELQRRRDAASTKTTAA